MYSCPSEVSTVCQNRGRNEEEPSVLALCINGVRKESACTLRPSCGPSGLSCWPPPFPCCSCPLFSQESDLEGISGPCGPLDLSAYGSTAVHSLHKSCVRLSVSSCPHPLLSALPTLQVGGLEFGWRLPSRTLTSAKKEVVMRNSGLGAFVKQNMGAWRDGSEV